ncbi:MAG: CARDB domain-containing protein, partial [Candidatus Hodarchaeota archaeon]
MRSAKSSTALALRAILLIVLFASVIVVYPVMAHSFAGEDNMTTEFEPSFAVDDYFMYEEIEGRWLDAVTNGVNLGVSGDDQYTSLALPFSFDFYDASYSTVYISSNGWLSFVTTDPYDFSNRIFPTSESRFDYSIAPYWDDLYANNDIYAWSTSEWVVIQYDTYDYLSGTQAGTFEAVLCSNGTILFNYLEILNAGTATVGLNYGDNIHYNSYPALDLVGLSSFTLVFSLSAFGHELEADIDTPSDVEIGMSYLINATALNLGGEDESNVELFLYLDGDVVREATIPLLAAGANESVGYLWTPVEDGIYNFTVYVSPVPEEGTISNNMKQEIVFVHSGLPIALFEDINVLGVESTRTVLNSYGIPYDNLTSADMGVVDLSLYEKVVIASYQPQSFNDAVNASISWFEDYVASGGIIEFHAFTSGFWPDNSLIAGVNYTSLSAEAMTITQPSNHMVNIPHLLTNEDVSNWLPTVWGHLGNLSQVTKVVIETADGNPVLVEFRYGLGTILISTHMLEYGYFLHGSMLLENILLYLPEVQQHDVG